MKDEDFQEVDVVDPQPLPILSSEVPTALPTIIQQHQSSTSDLSPASDWFDPFSSSPPLAPAFIVQQPVPVIVGSPPPSPDSLLANTPSASTPLASTPSYVDADNMSTSSMTTTSQFEDMSSSEEEEELVDCADFLSERPSKVTAMATSETERLAHRDQVAREIIATEKSYVNDLILARTLYLLPLKAGIVKRITHDRVRLIFGNMENLIEVNSLLLQKLAEREKQWHSQQLLADIFCEMAPMFLLYGDYCQSYGTGCELLKKLEMKPDVSQFLQRVAQESAVELRQLGLHDILIMPVQRLPRYLLLLRDLLKDTEPPHPDYENIKRAISSIQVVAEKVNEAIRLAESHQKLLELDRRITVNRHKMPRLIQPGRGLFKEGKLGKITSRFARKGVRFFITTDLLIYAYRIRGGSTAMCKLHFKGLVALGTSWIRDLQDADYKNVFQIVCPKKTYTVFADTPAIKLQWINALNERIVALVTRDPSLKAKRGPVLVSSKTKHFQAADPRFNCSPKTIRRIITTTTDLFAAPQLTTVVANPPRDRPYVVLEGQSPAPPSFEDENIEQFLASPNRSQPHGQSGEKDNPILNKLGLGKKKASSSHTGVPLLSLDDEGYQHFNGSDEDISTNLEFHEDDGPAKPTQPAHPQAQRPPLSSSSSPGNLLPPSDPLSFTVDAASPAAKRPIAGHPTEQTALRTSGRPASRPSSFMKPIGGEQRPLTAIEPPTPLCGCECTIM
ncbi:MAG: hypothetical protein Q8P67_19510 [archaeon]|nr:hypothetical protein [archaeon]